LRRSADWQSGWCATAQHKSAPGFRNLQIEILSLIVRASSLEVTLMGVSDKVARDALKMAGVVAATNNAVATTELPQLCGSLTTWAWSDNFSPIYSV
jgi:hypothetical protein